MKTGGVVDVIGAGDDAVAGAQLTEVIDEMTEASRNATDADV